MNSQWLGIVLLIALMIGYSVIGNRAGDGFDSPHEQPVMLGYYIKDAIITETSELGTPRVRFAASEVTQNIQDNSVTLAAVRADYLWPTKERVSKSNTATAPSNGNSHNTNHWVLNADRARIPAASRQSADRIELRDNVEAHSVDAAHNAALTTSSLDLDLNKQIARSEDLVRVDVDGHTATGRGLLVDMEKNQMQIKAEGTLRLAANTNDSSALSMPEAFKWDRWEYVDNTMVLYKVRSTSEPFISADRARATGANAANNQWILTGAVRLELASSGFVTADLGTVTVRNNRVVFAQLTGKPVNFQYQRKNDNRPVFGRAGAIDYDVIGQTLRFAGDAWFSDGKFEMKSDFEYNLATGEASGTSGSGGLVPRKSDSPASNPPSLKE